MPSPGLAVLVIDENRMRASIIEAGLREAGHDNVTVIHDVNGIARRIAEIKPDVIVIDLENPNRDMLENMFQLSRAVKRPIAMFVDRSRPRLDRGGSRGRRLGLCGRRSEAGARQADPRHGDQPLQRLLPADARAGRGAQRAREPQADRARQGHPDDVARTFAKRRPMRSCARRR